MYECYTIETIYFYEERKLLLIHSFKFHNISLPGFCKSCNIYLRRDLLPETGGDVCRDCLSKGECEGNRKRTSNQTGGKEKTFKGVLTEEIISEDSRDGDMIVHLQRHRERIVERLRYHLSKYK